MKNPVLRSDITDGEMAIREFVDAIERGEIPDTRTLKALASSLRDILQGTDLKKALGLQRRRGGGSGNLSQTARKLRTALIVRDKMKTGVTYDKAVEFAMNQLHLSYRTVQRRYSVGKAWDRYCPPLENLLRILDDNK